MQLKVLGPNRTELHLASGSIVFFSYNTPVAAFVPGDGYFRTSKRFSNTTTKHVNDWLRGFHAAEKSQDFFDKLICGSCVR
jgi:hypothetical protein